MPFINSQAYFAQLSAMTIFLNNPQSTWRKPSTALRQTDAIYTPKGTVDCNQQSIHQHMHHLRAHDKLFIVAVALCVPDEEELHIIRQVPAPAHAA